MRHVRSLLRGRSVDAATALLFVFGLVGIAVGRRRAGRNVMRSLNGFFASALALALWPAHASASVIYGVTYSAGSNNTKLYEIDPDAMTTNILEDLDATTSGVGGMATVGNGSNPDELLVGVGTGATTSLLRSYSLSGSSFGVVGAGEPGPIIGLGGTYFGAGGAPYLGAITDLYAIDPVSGVSTLVGVSPFGYAGDLAEHPTTGVLYAATTDPFLVTVNQSDASMTSLGLLPEYMVGLAFTQDGRLWALSLSSKLYAIDPSDGSGTFVMDALPDSHDLASQVVPEPSTASLLTLGLVGIAAVRRRRAQ